MIIRLFILSLYLFNKDMCLLFFVYACLFVCKYEEEEEEKTIKVQINNKQGKKSTVLNIQFVFNEKKMTKKSN